MKTYQPSLDGLRFLAFLLVYLHHHPWMAHAGPFRFVQREGWLGVDLFLALSAFLFARLLTLEHRTAGRIDTGRFYLRRVLRIWPAYFAYLGLAVAAHLALSGTAGFPYGRLASLATFTDNLATAFAGWNPLLETGHLWSIAYEEQFYLLLPPGIWLFAKLPRHARAPVFATLLAVGLALKGWTILHGPGQPAIWVLPWTHFESVALGGLLGLGRLERILGRLPSWGSAVLGLAFYAVLCALPSDQTASLWLFPKYLVSGVVAALWVHAALSWPSLRAFLARPRLVHLGKRSYGLYLFHGLAIVVADSLLRRALGLERSSLASFLLAPILTWIAAYISYRWLESPFLRWKRRFETVPSRPV